MYEVVYKNLSIPLRKPPVIRAVYRIHRIRWNDGHHGGNGSLVVVVTLRYSYGHAIRGKTDCGIHFRRKPRSTVHPHRTTTSQPRNTNIHAMTLHLSA